MAPVDTDAELAVRRAGTVRLIQEEREPFAEAKRRCDTIEHKWVNEGRSRCAYW